MFVCAIYPVPKSFCEANNAFTLKPTPFDMPLKILATIRVPQMLGFAYRPSTQENLKMNQYMIYCSALRITASADATSLSYTTHVRA